MSTSFMSETEADRLQRALAEANGFLLDALASNHAGRLTQEQAQHLRSEQATDRRIFLLLGVPATLISSLWLIRATAHSGLGGLLDQRIALVIFAVGLVLMWAGTWWKEYQRDFSNDAVESVEGLGTKMVRSLAAGSGGPAHYTFVIGDLHFEVSAKGHRPFVDGLLYRAYYVSQSHARTLVNIEVLGQVSSV